jgi:hypothetical protein
MVHGSDLMLLLLHGTAMLFRERGHAATMIPRLYNYGQAIAVASAIMRTEIAQQALTWSTVWVPCRPFCAKKAGRYGAARLEMWHPSGKETTRGQPDLSIRARSSLSNQISHRPPVGCLRDIHSDNS